MSVKFASPSIAAAGLASLAFHAKRGFSKKVAMDQDGRFAIAEYPGSERPFSRLWLRLVATGLGLFHRRTRNLPVNLPGIQGK
jgi:hypothetical protein